MISGIRQEEFYKLAKKRALLIDDQRQWYTVCQVLCEDFGYECVWATTPSKARDHLNENAFDVLILDLGFQQSGDTLLPEEVSEIDLLVARLQRTTKPLDILICTGLTDHTKISLVESQLRAARHNVQLFRKRDAVGVLYDVFSRVVGTNERTRQARPSPKDADRALYSLIAVFVLAVVVILISARLLSASTEFSWAIVGSAAFLCVMAGLLLFWRLGIFSRVQVVHFVDRVLDLVGRLTGSNTTAPRSTPSAKPRSSPTAREPQP